MGEAGRVFLHSLLLRTCHGVIPCGCGVQVNKALPVVHHFNKSVDLYEVIRGTVAYVFAENVTEKDVGALVLHIQRYFPPIRRGMLIYGDVPSEAEQFQWDVHCPKASRPATREVLLTWERDHGVGESRLGHHVFPVPVDPMDAAAAAAQRPIAKCHSTSGAPPAEAAEANGYVPRVRYYTDRSHIICGVPLCVFQWRRRGQARFSPPSDCRRPHCQPPSPASPSCPNISGQATAACACPCTWREAP